MQITGKLDDTLPWNKLVIEISIPEIVMSILTHAKNAQP